MEVTLMPDINPNLIGSRNSQYCKTLYYSNRSAMFLITMLYSGKQSASLMSNNFCIQSGILLSNLLISRGIAKLFIVSSRQWIVIQRYSLFIKPTRPKYQFEILSTSAVRNNVYIKEKSSKQFRSVLTNYQTLIYSSF